jgi:hypothetical protein
VLVSFRSFHCVSFHCVVVVCSGIIKTHLFVRVVGRRALHGGSARTNAALIVVRVVGRVVEAWWSVHDICLKLLYLKSLNLGCYFFIFYFLF